MKKTARELTKVGRFFDNRAKPLDEVLERFDKALKRVEAAVRELGIAARMPGFQRLLEDRREEMRELMAEMEDVENQAPVKAEDFSGVINPFGLGGK